MAQQEVWHGDHPLFDEEHYLHDVARAAHHTPEMFEMLANLVLSGQSDSPPASQASPENGSMLVN